MTYALKSCLVAEALTGACVPTIALAQSSTSPGTTTTPTADCTDVAADPNCKPNQNQKEPSDNSTNLNPEGELNNPSPQTQDPAANHNEQTPGSAGSPDNASGGNAVSPSGSENVEGDNAGGAGSAGSSGTNN